MVSHINIGVVQRHLDSVGHTLTSQGVADLLKDLGFSVSVEEEEIEETSLLKDERKSKEQMIKKNALAEPLFPTRTFKAVSAPPATATGCVGKAAPANSLGIASLAAKLDALEAQINDINNLQANLHQKLESDPRNRSATKSVVAPLASLGTEAEQLRDWAAGKWPNIREYKPFSSPSSSTGSSNSNSSKSIQNSKNKSPLVIKKQDPVARYQEIQKIWSRDPFLCSGAGDSKTSKRKEQGFRSTFAALHNQI